MSKIALVRIGWKKSVSDDVKKVLFSLTVNGQEQTQEFGPEVEEFRVEISARSNIHVSIVTEDSEGEQSVAATYDYLFGDFEKPQPVTGIFHEILSIRDSDDTGGGDQPA